MFKRILKWIGLGFLALILIAVIVYAFLPKGPRDLMKYTDRTKTEKQLLTADQFAVVAGTPWASQAGYDVLARGGNALPLRPRIRDHGIVAAEQRQIQPAA